MRRPRDAFREDTRRWLEANAPPSMRTPPRVARRGVLGRQEGRSTRTTSGAGSTSWPSAAGRRRRGRASTAAAGSRKEEAKVLAEEMAKLKLRPPLIGFGLEMIGPLLLQDGSEEQKREHLPRDRARRDPLVSGLLRAGRRLRPRQPADARGARRRRLRPERPEGLDVVRRQGRLDVHPGAHRHRRRSTTASPSS